MRAIVNWYHNCNQIARIIFKISDCLLPLNLRRFYYNLILSRLQIPSYNLTVWCVHCGPSGRIGLTLQFGHPVHVKICNKDQF